MNDPPGPREGHQGNVIQTQQQSRLGDTAGDNTNAEPARNGRVGAVSA